MAGKLNAQQGLKGTQRRRSGKQNQMGQQGRGTQNYRKKQTTGDANRGKPGGARVTANRLKNKQGSTQKVTYLKNNKFECFLFCKKFLQLSVVYC